MEPSPFLFGANVNETPVTASEAAAEDDLEALLEAALKDIEASEDLAGLDGLRK